MKNLKLLSKIALSFQNLENFDKRMNEILSDIGKLLDVSRIYIFINDSEEIVSNTFEWCDKGIKAQIENLQKTNTKITPSFYRMLREDGYICTNDINKLPQDMIDVLQPQKIKSIVAYPLFIRKETIGFIGFDECRYKRQWEEEELEILKTISGLVANAYERKFAQEDLIISETNFRNFFDTINDMFTVADLDGNIIHSNKSAIHKLGYSLRELKNMHISELHPENKRSEAANIIENIFKGQADTCHLEVESKFGDLYSVETRVWFGKWNKEDCIFSISKDMTKELELTMSLADKHQKLTNIIEGACLVTWELNLQTKEIACSDSGANILGYSLEEVGSTDIENWYELLHPEDMKTSFELLEKHLRGELEFYESEMRVKHGDGSWIWILTRGKISQVDDYGKPLKMFGVYSDISLRKETEIALRESERRFFLALDETKAGLWDIDLINRTMFLSSMGKKILGYSDNEIKNSIYSWINLIHPDDMEETIKTWKDFIKGRLESYEHISRFKHKDGGWRWILIRGGSLIDEDNIASRVIGTIIDITRDQEQALELERFFSVNLDLLCIVSLEGKFIKTNKAWEEILGRSSEELKGSNILDIVHPDDIPKTMESLKKLQDGGEVTKFINRCINRQGSYSYIEWRSTPYENLIYAAARDITDRIKYEEKILEMSYRDPLTNAYNRRYIFARIKEIIEEYKRINKIFSLCIIDIDNFKRINDNYGHQAGDYILKELTKIIEKTLRPYDLLGRFGGEEFIIVLKDIDGEKSKIVIERILNKIKNKSFAFNGHDISVTFSAGISTCTEVEKDDDMLNNLLNIADQRMYYAKNRGKCEVVIG